MIAYPGASLTDLAKRATPRYWPAEYEAGEASPEFGLSSEDGVKLSF